MPETRYLDIAATLESELAGAPVGTRVASESELAARFGVGRSAARAALQHLQRRNRIRRVKGVGSFVARRIDYRIGSDAAPSWSHTVRAAGGEPSSVTLSCAPAPVPPSVAPHLGLAPGDPAHRLTRRSLVDGLPAACGVEWVPRTVVPELGQALRVRDSLYEVLREAAGARPVRRWVRASADVVTDEVARHLDLDDVTLGWFIESCTVDQGSGRPLLVSQRWIRADAMRVLFEAGATG
ncbi:GntR family transcriptional regulator [Curtobacterium oceanosedimentum]|uniref:GntR family transcriptional regulator n=1 Tax=Curtobacterium oceanosedimentum TaxID=465820 RepID=UPI001CE123CD|nr:GntR family transcriptional regulator [Curtobacterium oceanosedimentum]MCA5922573.1 GntR family transcriptional regulator [Curtobacterium oceanosedimentum]